MEPHRVNLNIPLAHFQPVLSWEQSTIDDLVDRDTTQTDELTAMAAESVRSAIEKGADAEPDNELADELYEHVREAAAELGVDAPALP